MFSPFRMGPAASGFGLYDIDRGLFRFTWYGITCQKWEILARRKYADITLNNSLWISYSPRPLAAGPIRNAEKIESLLKTHRFMLFTFQLGLNKPDRQLRGPTGRRFLNFSWSSSGPRCQIFSWSGPEFLKIFWLSQFFRSGLTGFGPRTTYKRTQKTWTSLTGPEFFGPTGTRLWLPGPIFVEILALNENIQNVCGLSGTRSSEIGQFWISSRKFFQGYALNKVCDICHMIFFSLVFMKFQFRSYSVEDS